MRHHRILTALASLGLATAGLALVGQSAEAADSRCNRTNDSLRKLLECVTLDGVMEHQEAFQEIADDERRHPRVRHARATTPRPTTSRSGWSAPATS